MWAHIFLGGFRASSCRSNPKSSQGIVTVLRWGSFSAGTNEPIGEDLYTGCVAGCLKGTIKWAIVWLDDPVSASYICLWFAVILARCSVISLTLRLLVCVCVCLLTPERVPLLLTPSVICWWDCCGQLTVYTQKSVSRSKSSANFQTW